MDNQMLSLTEYSSRHRVSISTLRRRIKSNDIPYVLKDGKYFIKENEQQVAPTSDATYRANHRPSLVYGSKDTNISPSLKNSDSDVGVSERLFVELKRAYSQILHEKEEQIIVLKEEISDLKTLVKVLEAENDRLQRP